MSKNADDAFEMPEAYRLVLRLGVLLKKAPLTQFDQCWEFEVDEEWSFAMNGHRDERSTTLSKTRMVPKLSCLVVWRGHQAGMMNPFGGAFAAPPEDSDHDVSEAAFISALKEKIMSIELQSHGGVSLLN